MRLEPKSSAMTVLLAFMTAIGPVTMDIYLASMAHIGAALAATTAEVQLTLSFYLIGFAIGQIFYGPLSDSLGRRPMLLLGFALYLVATATCALATSIEMLMIARMFQSLGAAGPIIIARAIVRDHYSGAEAAKKLGMMSAIQGIAPIGAPVLGGFLQAAFGWRASFVAMGTIGTVLTLVAVFLLQETNTRKGETGFAPKAIAQSFSIILNDKGYISYLAMLALSYCGVFAFLASSSHILQNLYKLNAVQFGFTYALCSSGYIFGNYSGTKLVTHLRLEGMLKLGAVVMLAGALLQVAGYLLFPQSYLAIIVPDILYFIGCAWMVPQLIAAAMTPFGERAGAASSLMGFSQMISAATVASILGLILGKTAWPLVGTMLLFALVVIAILYLTRGIRDVSRAPRQID